MAISTTQACAYLPHNVKFVNESFCREQLTTENESLYTHNLSVHNVSDVVKNDNCKLILRPIEDLEKDEFNIFKDMIDCWRIIAQVKNTSVNFWSCWLFEQLVSNHFDIYGLIKENKAIDINSITNGN